MCSSRSLQRKVLLDGRHIVVDICLPVCDGFFWSDVTIDEIFQNSHKIGRECAKIDVVIPDVCGIAETIGQRLENLHRSIGFITHFFLQKFHAVTAVWNSACCQCPLNCLFIGCDKFNTSPSSITGRGMKAK